MASNDILHRKNINTDLFHRNGNVDAITDKDINIVMKEIYS